MHTIVSFCDNRVLIFEQSSTKKKKKKIGIRFKKRWKNLLNIQFNAMQ